MCHLGLINITEFLDLHKVKSIFITKLKSHNINSLVFFILFILFEQINKASLRAISP